MQRQFADTWNKMYQSLTKPLADLTELNMNTLNNWSKNQGYFEELAQVKKPEDFITTQIKLANIGQLEAMTYAKKAGDIMAKAFEEWSDICKNAAYETAAKTSEVMRTEHKIKEK